MNGHIALTALLIAPLAQACGAGPAPAAPPASAPSSSIEKGATEGAPGDRESDSDATVALRLDEPHTAGRLTLTWRTLEDSRCPEGVTCVWAGQATVGIDVAEDGGEPQRVQLTLGGRGSDQATVGEHRLRLLAVEPYPRDGVRTPRDEQRARLAVAAATDR